MEPLYSFQLPRGLLKALALFQAADDHPALACTSFEIRRALLRHELTTVAIDGRRLAMYQSEILQDTLFGNIPDEDNLVVDLQGCNSLPKQTPDYVTVEVHAKFVDFIADKIRYTAQRLESVDGCVRFPAWRAVIPSSRPENVEQIAVNHDLLADFGKAAKLICGDRGHSIALRTFGEGSPISVQIMGHREFYGIIMPLKSEHPEAVPDWLLTEKERKQAAAPQAD